MSSPPSGIQWVVLTTGNRPEELTTAVGSIVSQSDHRAVVVSNGAGPIELPGARVLVVESPENLGVPGGRDRGIEAATTDIVGFIDDDARLPPNASTSILAAFDEAPGLGAVALRLVDEQGRTSRRHLPRAGGGDATTSGPVAYFLGGACAIRRSAYDEVGGYFTELFYGHEEIELSWRLIDAGWSIRYLADVEVFHPRTDIGRHADGWRLTGRNRVWIARRTLPWPIAIVHVTVWLVLGSVRAPRGACREAYLRGWFSGWRGSIAHRPIRWRTVAELTKLGRPPLI
jgi:GT2 family glycosyltransferase